MGIEPRVQQLLDEILDSDRTPEEVCRDCPEPLPEVHKYWQQMRIVDAELNGLFPSAAPGDELSFLPVLPTPDDLFLEL